MASYNNFIPEYKGNTTNRRIMYGPSNELWPVPQGTTEVEVHVWGGGGGSCTSPTPLPRGYGGGGGGYARARYSVTSTDCLCIVVGGNGGTSTVTIPTQAPTSPVSATGGTSGTCPGPGSFIFPGGSGTVSLGPTHPTCYCFTADGGNGFGGPFTQPLVSSSGGAAGSPKGVGGFGTTGEPCFAGGGGIGYGGQLCFGGPGKPQVYNTGPALGGSCEYDFCGNSAFRLSSTSDQVNLIMQVNNCGHDWFYVEDISGDGGMEFCYRLSPTGPTVNFLTHATAGGGGGANCSRAGFLGGGGGAPCCAPQNIPGVNASGGCAGGSAAIHVGPPSPPHSGGSFPGTPGVVIVYW